MRIKKGKLAALLCTVLLLPGCSFQSINNSGSGLLSQSSPSDSPQSSAEESREEPTTEPENRKIRRAQIWS